MFSGFILVFLALYVYIHTYYQYHLLDDCWTNVPNVLLHLYVPYIDERYESKALEL